MFRVIGPHSSVKWTLGAQLSVSGKVEIWIYCYLNLTSKRKSWFDWGLERRAVVEIWKGLGFRQKRTGQRTHAWVWMKDRGGWWCFSLVPLLPTKLFWAWCVRGCAKTRRASAWVVAVIILGIVKYSTHTEFLILKKKWLWLCCRISPVQLH